MTKYKVPQAVMDDLEQLKKSNADHPVVTDIIDKLRPERPEDKENPTALQKWVEQQETFYDDDEIVHYNYQGIAQLELDIVNFVIHDANNFEVKNQRG